MNEKPDLEKNKAGVVQYDETVSERYHAVVDTDPKNLYVRFPAVLNMLGNVSQKTILDVGCGNGAFAQELARRGARVVGYDASAEQITLARKAQKDNPSAIEYHVASSRDFRSDTQFDEAVSMLVLHYAPDKKYLEDSFAATYKMLKESGRFICLLANPDFQRIGEVVHGRRFTRLPNGKMQVEFYADDGTLSFTVEYSDFSKAEYEEAARNAGFTRSEWVPLKVDPAGKEKMGEEYWKGFEEDCLYVGFVSYK